MIGRWWNLWVALGRSGKEAARRSTLDPALHVNHVMIDELQVVKAHAMRVSLVPMTACRDACVG